MNNGTIKLLNSSPIRTRELVFGKFLGLTGLNIALVSSIALLLFTGYFTIQHAEFAWYCSILLGFFLLISAYLAIGIYISTITNYPIVACIITFLVFMILGIIGTKMQEYDIIRDITWFLSINGRTEQMISGLITTREICYYVLIIFFFFH